MSRIIESLKSAIRFAKGDKSAGKVTTVPVPLTTEDILDMAKRGQGRWVASDDMLPIANVYGRVYRSDAGKIGVYYPGSLPPALRIADWFFPDLDSKPCEIVPFRKVK